MKRLILMSFIFVWSNLIWASPFFTAAQIKKLDINQQTELYLSYIKFFRDQERESIWKYADVKSKSAFFHFLENNILLPAAYALNGNYCFFGGWKSKVQGDTCTHPRDAKGIKYKSNCPDYKFQCNPALFGNTCVIPFEGYEGLTDRCWKEFNDKNLIKPFLAGKSWEDFEQTELDVDRFCKANRYQERKSIGYIYDSCETLYKHLAQLKDYLKKHPPGDEKTPSLNDVVKVVTTTTEITEQVTLPLKSNCYATNCNEIDNCSESLLERSKRTFSRSIRGAILFQDVPQEKCMNKVDVNGLDFAQLDRFIRGEGIFEQPATSFYHTGAKCLEPLIDKKNKKQAALAKTYMMIDFYDKQARLAQGTDALFKGIAEINALLEQPLVEASDFCHSAIAKVDQQCKRLKECPNTKGLGLLESRAEHAQDALKEIMQLEQKKKELHNTIVIGRRNRSYRAKKFKEFGVKNIKEVRSLKHKVQDRIDELKHLYPWLAEINDRGKREKLLADKKQMAMMAKDFYQKKKEELVKLYQDNIRAYHCMFDTQGVDYSKDCSDVDLIIKRNPHLDYSGLKHKFGGAFDYYQCAENQRYLNEEQVDRYTDYAIIAGLSVIPFGLGHLGRAALLGSRLLMAADTAYVANNIRKDYKQCSELNKQLEQIDTPKMLSCQNFSLGNNAVKLAVERENCVKSGLTAAGIAMLPYATYGASKYLGKLTSKPKVSGKVPIEKHKKTVTTVGRAIVRVENRSMMTVQPKPHSVQKVKKYTDVIDVEIIPTPKRLPAPKAKLSHVKALPPATKSSPVRSEVKLLPAKIETPVAKSELKLLSPKPQSLITKETKSLPVVKKGYTPGTPRSALVSKAKKYPANKKILLAKREIAQTAMKSKLSSTTAKFSALTYREGSKLAEKDFIKILEQQGLDYKIYLKKNFSPKNRKKLVNALLKRDGIKTGRITHGNRRERASKLKKLIKQYRQKIKDASSEAERGYFEQWLKLLEGV